MNPGARTVEVLDELLQSALVFEYVRLGLALVDELDANARVEEGQLTKPLRQNVVFEGDVREDGWAGLEAHGRTTLSGVTRHRERGNRITQAEFHLVRLSILMDGQPEMVGQSVHDRDTDAVQATRD